MITVFSEFADPDSTTAADSCFRIVSSTTHTPAFLLHSLNIPNYIIGYIPAGGRIKIVPEANIGSAIVEWYLKGKVSCDAERTMLGLHRWLEMTMMLKRCCFHVATYVTIIQTTANTRSPSRGHTCSKRNWEMSMCVKTQLTRCWGWAGGWSFEIFG